MEVMTLIVLSFLSFERFWPAWTGGERYSPNLVEAVFSEVRSIEEGRD